MQVNRKTFHPKLMARLIFSVSFVNPTKVVWPDFLLFNPSYSIAMLNSGKQKSNLNFLGLANWNSFCRMYFFSSHQYFKFQWIHCTSGQSLRALILTFFSSFSTKCWFKDPHLDCSIDCMSKLFLNWNSFYFTDTCHRYKRYLYYKFYSGGISSSYSSTSFCLGCDSGGAGSGIQNEDLSQCFIRNVL